MRKKLLSLVVTTTLLISLLGGCAGGTTPEATTPAVDAPVSEFVVPDSPAPAELSEVPGNSDPQATLAKYQVSLPLVQEEMTISMYLLIPPFITSALEDITNLSVLGALEERTGLNFSITPGNYIDGASVLNIMLAGGDYPDIINHIDLYATGAQAAVDDEIVIDLYDYVVNDMPNLYAELTRHKGTMKQLSTELGYIAYFPQLLSEPEVNNFSIGLRTDLMEELGYSEPTTFSELHDILLDIYDNYGLQFALTNDGTSQGLMTGYNISPLYRVVDGTVEYCYVVPEMYDYLSMVSQWFKEKIIIPDFISYQSFSLNEMLATGSLSSTGMANASTIDEADTRGEGIIVSAINYVTPNAGDSIKIYGEGMIIRCAAWSISTGCAKEKIPIICNMVEYLFSDEGTLLFNYGVEGEGYYLDENNEPQWSDLIINSDSGFTTASVLYATGNPSEYICGVFDIEKFYYSYNERQYKAIEIINTSSTGEYDYPLGADSMISIDNQTIVANIKGDLDTYISETVLGWIMGEKELNEDTWNAYIEHCNSMGIQTVIDIYQDAYERFLAKE